MAVGCATLPPAPPNVLVDPPNDALARRVAAIAAKAGGRFGVAAIHVESGRFFEWNAEESFEAASVIKVALLAEAAARAADGRLDLAERWRIPAGLVADGSGLLDEFEPGLMPSNRDLLRLMIAVSDNTAANRFIDFLGREAVNARMCREGLPGIALLGRIPEKPAQGESPAWRGLVLGRMTPRATASFYRKVVEGTLVSPRVSRLVLDVLETQHTVSRIPRLLLSETSSWAGKTGTMNRVRNDSGVLTTPKGRFVLVVFADGLEERGERAARASAAMGEIASAIVETWSKDLPYLPDPARTRFAAEPSFALPRVELTLAEAERGAPYAERVHRETDRRFWELWTRAGGDARDACLVPMPNSWWEGEMPSKVEPVSSIVLHHTSFATDEGTVRYFLDPKSFVSSHFLVGRDGRLFQFVSLEHRAWHAGRSYLHGRQALNRTSIGVEITGDGNLTPYTRAQVETVVRLVGVLTALFDVKAPFLAGHEHVAPDRKDDPGVLFPWNEVVRRSLELAERLSGAEKAVPIAP